MSPLFPPPSFTHFRGLFYLGGSRDFCGLFFQEIAVLLFSAKGESFLPSTKAGRFPFLRGCRGKPGSFFFFCYWVASPFAFLFFSFWGLPPCSFPSGRRLFPDRGRSQQAPFFHPKQVTCPSFFPPSLYGSLLLLFFFSLGTGSKTFLVLAGNFFFFFFFPPFFFLADRRSSSLSSLFSFSLGATEDFSPFSLPPLRLKKRRHRQGRSTGVLTGPP